MVATGQPGFFAVTARLVSDPSVSTMIAVNIVPIGSPTLRSVTGGSSMIAPGAPIHDVIASMDVSGSAVAGVPVTFTVPASGASALFTNNATTVTVDTDVFGWARAGGTANSTPGSFAVQASVGTQKVSVGTSVIVGSATIRLDAPAVLARYPVATFHATFDLPWLPCGPADTNRLAELMTFTVDDAPVPTVPAGLSTGCAMPGSYETVSTTVWANGLLPGTHVLKAAFASSSATAPVRQVFTLAPDFEGPSATGAGTLRLAVSDPNTGGDSGGCDKVTAVAGKLGDPGMPAAPPPGFDLPYGLVQFSGSGCTWGNDLGAPRSTPMQRVALGIDGPLPPSTAAWEYGPTPDDTQPHWHALATALSGTYAVFEVAGEALPIPGFALQKVVALGEPGAGTVRNYQDLWWGGLAENGWGMSLTQHRDVLFGALFIYDAAGDPTWLVMPGGQWNADHTVYTGDLYRPHGSPYSAYNAAAFAVGASVGRASLTFDSDATFTLAYAIDAIEGTKRLERQLFGPVEPFAIPPVADLWWGGEAQNGWGFALAQQYRTLFGVLFTYDANGDPVWFAAPSGSLQWQLYDATLYRTHASAWLGTAYDPAQLSVTEAGTAGEIWMTFEGWDEAVLNFRIDGTRVSQDVVRQPF